MLTESILITNSEYEYNIEETNFLKSMQLFDTIHLFKTSKDMDNDDVTQIIFCSHKTTAVYSWVCSGLLSMVLSYEH